MSLVYIIAECSNFHVSLDEAIECLQDYIIYHKIVTKSKSNTLSPELIAELMAYAATFIAMIKADNIMHSGIWNTFKKAVENRMLAIEDDGSKRDGLVKTPHGVAYAHFTSSYWGFMDKIEELVKAVNESGQLKKDNELVSKNLVVFLGWDSKHEREFQSLFSDLIYFASNSIFPKVERAFS